MEQISANSQMLIVAVEDLRTGMFVADLDRPWIGTPFLLQGFLIENNEEIAQLRQCCRFVQIDPARSVGVAMPVSTQKPVLRAEPSQLLVQIQENVRRGRIDFFGFLRRLRRRGSDGAEDIEAELIAALQEAMALAARNEEVPLELELLACTAAFDAAERAVERVLQEIEAGSPIDLGEAETAVRDMVRSVLRNPEALMWMTRLRITNQQVYQRALDASIHMMVFGRSLGMRTEELQLLGLAGLVLDVGRLRLPEALTSKQGGITRMEYEVFKCHVDYSLQILGESGSSSAVLMDVVRRHHERIDGSGYPNGLSGAGVGLYGEMAGLVDCYCAMTRHRNYAEALSSQQALERLMQTRGSHFSEHVVDQFAQCVGIYPIGSLVELHTGEVAVVVAQNRVRRLKPRVMVLLYPNKQPMSYPPTLDLLYDPVAPDGAVYRVVRGLAPESYGINPQEFYLA